MDYGNPRGSVALAGVDHPCPGTLVAYNFTFKSLAYKGESKIGKKKVGKFDLNI